jgi:hypothetical protein
MKMARTLHPTRLVCLLVQKRATLTWLPTRTPMMTTFQRTSLPVLTLAVTVVDARTNCADSRNIAYMTVDQYSLVS